MIRTFLALFLIPFSLFATDLKPWFPTSLEFQLQGSYAHQFYNQLHIAHTPVSYRSRDDFYRGSLQFAYSRFCAEYEMMFAKTKRQDFDMAANCLTLRFQPMDDISGDIVSLVIGVTGRQVFSSALHDISLFHHGRVEAELNLSVGKENSTFRSWSSRWWAEAGIGIGDQGASSPWLRGKLAFEKALFCFHRLSVFSELLYGLGSRNINLVLPFPGYGRIRHQSIDVGGRWEWDLCWNGTFAFEYKHRIHSYNAPRGAGCFQLAYTYPLGL